MHSCSDQLAAATRSVQEQFAGEKQEENFHVLAVDDSLVDRKLLERLLSASSYQVTCVDSGDKALEYLGLLDNIQEEEAASASSCSFSSKSCQQKLVSKVNLIITDYSMPGITGYDLLKKVKESSWKDIPVIVVSSEDVPSRINMCLEGGALEFLLKPVKLSDLSKIHSHLLNSKSNCNYTNIDNTFDHPICNHETDAADNNNNPLSCSSPFSFPALSMSNSFSPIFSRSVRSELWRRW